jgi:hypothetical protein
MQTGEVRLLRLWGRDGDTPDGWRGWVTKPARFTQSDVTRAIRAFEKAGLSVKRARIEPDGAIEVVAGEPESEDKSNWFAGGPLYRDVA